MPNALIRETSPYLLQHAHNPVHWYPWGAQALHLARESGKPVFLSIGYSSCHWCHVMERECFNHAEIARILNDSFISIKVDREERPDVDHRYMQAITAMGIRGGWPLNVFLTPELNPFFGGTYFPPEDYQGHKGFKSILRAIAESWKNAPQILREQALRIEHAVSASLQTRKSERPYLGRSYIEKAQEEFLRAYDPLYGGFGYAPKFPCPPDLRFLLTQGEKFYPMVRQTLLRITQGGISDQIGGGIHRYSTDREWFLPHFEKMLYDQAEILKLTASIHQAAPEERWFAYAGSVVAYALRDLRNVNDLFYSAEDADSEGREGKFYLWEYDELRDLLTEEELPIARLFWGILPQGNIARDPQGEFGQSNLLAQIMDPAEIAARLRLSPEEIRARIDSARDKLFTARGQKKRPMLDTKILTDWNAMMIGALATAGRVFQQSAWTAQAVRSMRALKNHARKPSGWIHCARPGLEDIPAYREDLVHLTSACLDLYEATQDPHWLIEARELDLLILDMPQSFLTEYDGPHAAGYSTLVHNLIRLHRLHGNDTYLRRAIDILEQYAQQLWDNPLRHSHLMHALHLLLSDGDEFLIFCDERACRRI